jgi:hypothetical protein
MPGDTELEMTQGNPNEQEGNAPNVPAGPPPEAEPNSAVASFRRGFFTESRRGPSPYERGAGIAPTHGNAPLMRRMQDSHFREVPRVTNLWLKIKYCDWKVEAREQEDEHDHTAEFETMCRKQKGLTMISEDHAKTYVIEIKMVSQFRRGKGNKKKGANI